MPQTTTSEMETAREILLGVQRILKGPGKRYSLNHHVRVCPKTRKIIETCKFVIGSSYCSTTYMYYDPDGGPDLVICDCVGGDPNVELLRINLTYPRSLVRAYLRERIKTAIGIYADKRRDYYEQAYGKPTASNP